MFKYKFTTIAGKEVVCDNLILIRKTCEVNGIVGGVVVAEYEDGHIMPYFVDRDEYRRLLKIQHRYFTYPAVFDDRENGKDYYTVTFPSVSAALGEGKGMEKAMLDGKEGLEASIVDEDWYLQNSQLDTNIPYLSNTVNPNVLPIALVKAAYPDCKVKFITADLKHAKEITVYPNKENNK